MRLAESVKAHPVLTAVMVLCTVIGAAAWLVYGPAEDSVTRRLVGGAFAGAGIGFIIVCSRMIGAFGDEG